MSEHEQDALGRFLEAQDAGGTYERALGELRAGSKHTHWMWFVFPQLAGLGRSEMSKTYAIASLAEASAYLEHPVLGARLLECVRALVELPRADARAILGEVDALKLRSSMTLFARAAPEQPLFVQVLARYFEGVGDEATGRGLESVADEVCEGERGSVNVRPVEVGDLDALLELYRALACGRDEAAPAADGISERMLAAILAERGRHLLVAVLEGRVVGTADLLIVANLTHRARPWAVLENVIVAPGVRRHGVGRQLLGRIVELARTADCYKVQLISRKQRLEAHAFYRSLGFDALGEGFRLYLD